MPASDDCIRKFVLASKINKTQNHVFPVITTRSNSNENVTIYSSVCQLCDMCLQGPKLASSFNFF